MARVRIDLPEKKLAVIELPVRISDINYGNHLGNDSMVGIIHEARLQWLSSLNFTEINIDGAGLIMSDLVIEFKSESFYGDKLYITIFIGEISSSSFELYYSISNQNNKLVAKAKTGMVCFDYEQRKVIVLPEKLRPHL